jgi:N-dimethylarginine dimethylaminohydrolase
MKELSGNSPIVLMTDPEHFDVRYAINPWMKPDTWRLDSSGHRRSSRVAWESLRSALAEAGASVEVVAGASGWPDMVFPANAAVVLDGRALLARFRHVERQGEEIQFRSAFGRLQRQGFFHEVAELPAGLVHEGAGDSIWDGTRQLFWTGFGPRSDEGAAEAIACFFGRTTVTLELVSAHFYHLDTCFCPLSGGEVLWFPPAFSQKASHRIRELVAHELLIEASPQEATALCVNAISLGRTIVMAGAPSRLTAILAERGYTVKEIDLSPFILSGGGAFCLTLRLDLEGMQGFPARATTDDAPAWSHTERSGQYVRRQIGAAICEGRVV